MEFRVLGPLRVHGDDGQPRTFEPRQVRVLAVLLLAAGQMVTRSQLIDAVWDDPPATAARQLRNLVSALRHRLAAPVIVADGPGYRIPLDDAYLDSRAFVGHLTRARALQADDQIAPAAAELRAALALWRGPALAGCTGRIIQAGAARLDEQRLTALELCLDLELRLGRHDDLVGELTELVANHPLRERLVGQLMLALHRCGRQADALDAYRQLRTRLADELGIDPGAALRELHTAILRNTSPKAAPLPEPVRVLPRQLPAPIGYFVGRTVELKELNQLRDLAADGPVVATINGIGGIGKTALALHWAHDVADTFPDGQLYLNLRGFDPAGSPMTPAEAIRNLLDAFALPADRIPAHLDAQIALYRSIVAGKRVLVVLDNARDAAQVRPLLPGGPGCMTVVTSRDRLTGLIISHGANAVPVDLLSTKESRYLLSHRVGAGRVAAEPDAVDAIITGCARLPLALAIVAARAALDPRHPLSTLAEELGDERRRLDTLDAGDATTDVRTAFSWSYRQLTEPVARTFRRLGLHPGPSVSVPAAAVLAGIPTGQATAALTELTNARLLDQPATNRFTIHDLLRVYAAELTHTQDSAAERRVARERMLDHYLHTAHAAARQLNPHRISIIPERPHPAAEQIADHQHAMDWFDAEHATLIGAINLAEQCEFDTHAWQLAWTLADFLERRGRWPDWIATQSVALRATSRLADREAQAHAHRGLGRALARSGHHDDARSHLLSAVDLFGGLGHQAGEARTHLDLSMMLELHGSFDDGHRHARMALDLYRAAGHSDGQARALNAVGWGYALRGEYDQTLTYCRQALDLHQRVGDRFGEAATWDSLGYAHHHLGQHDSAIDCYLRTVALRRELGDLYNEADALIQLGHTYQAGGNEAAARDSWQQALQILDDLDHPDADQVRQLLAG